MYVHLPADYCENFKQLFRPWRDSSRRKNVLLGFLNVQYPLLFELILRDVMDEFKENAVWWPLTKISYVISHVKNVRNWNIFAYEIFT